MEIAWYPISKFVKDYINVHIEIAWYTRCKFILVEGVKLLHQVFNEFYLT